MGIGFYRRNGTDNHRFFLMYKALRFLVAELSVLELKEKT